MGLTSPQNFSRIFWFLGFLFIRKLLGVSENLGHDRTPPQISQAKATFFREVHQVRLVASCIAEARWKLQQNARSHGAPRHRPEAVWQGVEVQKTKVRNKTRHHHRHHQQQQQQQQQQSSSIRSSICLSIHPSIHPPVTRCHTAEPHALPQLRVHVLRQVVAQSSSLYLRNPGIQRTSVGWSSKWNVVDLCGSMWIYSSIGVPNIDAICDISMLGG